MILLWLMFVFEHEADFDRPRYVHRLAERPRSIAGGAGVGRVDAQGLSGAQSHVILDDRAEIRDELHRARDPVGARGVRGRAERQPLSGRNASARRLLDDDVPAATAPDDAERPS